MAITDTIHVSYRPGMTDRGKLYAFFRKLKGFRLVGFYDSYCFVRFDNKHFASEALANPPFGSVTLEPAKISYSVPYPQPKDGQLVSCRALHITHLPPNSFKDEVESMFSVFEGLSSIQLHGKYGYAHFKTELQAMQARMILRAETNLVISFAKNAPRPVPSPDIENVRFENTLPIRSPTFDSYSSPNPSVKQKSMNLSSFSQEYSNNHSPMQVARNNLIDNLNIGGTWHESPASYPSPPPLTGISTPSSTYSEYPWSRRSSMDIAQSGYHKFPSNDASFLDAGSYEIASLYSNYRDMDKRNVSITEIQHQFLQLQLLEQAYQQQLQNRRQIYFADSNSRFPNQTPVAKERRDNSIDYSLYLETLTEAFAGTHLQDKTSPASKIWSPFQSKLPGFTNRI
ncbi:hypothetical protein HK096_007972 [Nowakowskiella sp. JEL0078]|nr:hypothetical protein HK096_007972 [Nowakowskiella sp. JEL0078]